MSHQIPEEKMRILEDMAKTIEINLNNLLNTTKRITLKHIEEYEAKWPIEKQYLKIYEETGEAEKAYNRQLPTDNMEHFDILFSWITLAHFRDKTREENYKAILECLIKFEGRSWI